MCGEHLKNVQFPIFYVIATHRKWSEALLCVDLNAFFYTQVHKRRMDKKTLKLFLKTEKETKAGIDHRRNKYIISNKTDAA